MQVAGAERSLVAGAEEHSRTGRAPDVVEVDGRAVAGDLLGEDPLEHDERAGAAAVVVPRRALAGQPGEQPGLVVVVGEEPRVVAGDGVEVDEALPEGALAGESAGGVGEVDGDALGAAGHGRAFRGWC